MRALLWIAVVLSASAAAAEPESITLGNKLPKVGSKIAVNKSSTVDVKVTANGKTVPVVTTTAESKTIVILALAGDAVSKASVTYTVDEKREKMGDKTKDESSPLVGKTFTLTATGTSFTVATPKGPASEPELSLVNKREKRFGQPDRIQKALSGRKFVKGKSVDLDAKDFPGSFVDDPDVELTKMTMTYRGKAGANAKFDMRMVITSKKKGANTKFDLSGSVVIESVTGALVELSIAGTVKDAKVDGTMKMQERVMQQ